jgi:hypothetical protein
MVPGSRSKYSRTAILVIIFLLLCKATPAQTSAEQAKKLFTLEQAVDFALKNYPAVRASLERLRSAEADASVARTSYFPRTDVLWQSNRATDNNITGLTLPNSVIAPITGPVSLATSNRSAWGSAYGLLFSWEPLDFGYRGARVDAARAVQSRAGAEASLIFAGTITRVAHSVDVKTRTKPVELDVNNSDGRLSFGMFPEVLWPVRRTEPTLFVPTSAVARTTEATFVIRVREGNTEGVNVQTGKLDGKSIEVFGGLRGGDEVALRGTDELRPGTRVTTKPAAPDSADLPK